MKKLIILTIVLISATVTAQVAVGKANVDGGALLDFRQSNGTDRERGIILPKVETLNTSSVSGTIYFNAINGQVEYLDNFGVTVALTSGNTSITPLSASLSDNPSGGVVVTDGTVASGAPGVLVLESNIKSLILPKVNNPQTAILNPQPGMIVYDLISKTMAVYNGEKWSFWN